MIDFTGILRALNSLRDITAELDRISFDQEARDRVETDTAWRSPQSRYGINAITGKAAR